MKPIHFEHIPEIGLSINQEFSASELSELLAEPNRELSYQGTKPTHVTFKLERKNKDALLTGGGHFRLAHACVRCLEPVEIEHELVFDLELEQPEVIDLKELLREELFLELPLYPSCESNCLA